jgi:hypothetical protein
VRRVSDAFLLNMAEVTTTLIGLFLVGVFFYVESGFRRWNGSRDVFQPYLRSGTRITLIVLAIPLGVSLSLVVLTRTWTTVVFVVLSVTLIVANVDSARRVRGVRLATGSTALLLNEIVTTVLTVLLISVPWILGGLHPTREDFTWSILLGFAAGLLSIGAIVMSAFDVVRPRPTTEPPSGAGSAETEGHEGDGPRGA